jgi:hypothetical protein
MGTAAIGGILVLRFGSAERKKETALHKAQDGITKHPMGIAHGVSCVL